MSATEVVWHRIRYHYAKIIVADDGGLIREEDVAIRFINAFNLREGRKI